MRTCLCGNSDTCFVLFFLVTLRMESDGFKLVSRKRKSKSNRFLRRYDIRDIGSRTALQLGNISIGSEEVLLEQVKKCQTELTEQYLDIFRQTMANVVRLQNGTPPSPVSVPYFDRIVCYGLGSFTTDITSLYQLALLLLLRDQYTKQMMIYDPCFDDLERDILRSFQFELMNNNNNCYCKIIKTGSLPILFYMPHMYDEHYVNVLESNQDQLEDLIIYGNSFESRLNIENYRKYLIELNVNNQFHLKDVFNDQSIHAFKKM